MRASREAARHRASMSTQIRWAPSASTWTHIDCLDATTAPKVAAGVRLDYTRLNTTTPFGSWWLGLACTQERKPPVAGYSPG